MLSFNHLAAPPAPGDALSVVLSSDAGVVFFFFIDALHLSGVVAQISDDAQKSRHFQRRKKKNISKGARFFLACTAQLAGATVSSTN